MKNIINTDFRTLLIKFQFQSTNGQFICKFSELPTVLKELNQPGHDIQYIKEFDPVKVKFKHISKPDILHLFKDTEHEEYINDHYYFN